jgi:transcription antitermination factor NusG
VIQKYLQDPLAGRIKDGEKVKITAGRFKGRAP